ncbi:MAG: hypothetical protein VW985_11100, partial [Gammaproteobacteria bacterium]
AILGFGGCFYKQANGFGVALEQAFKLPPSLFTAALSAAEPRRNHPGKKPLDLIGPCYRIALLF